MDMETITHRLEKCEEDIKTLYSKSNKADVAQAEIATKLNNVLLELGKVREAVDGLKMRPARMWDKFLYAVLGALAAALVSMIITGGI